MSAGGGRHRCDTVEGSSYYRVAHLTARRLVAILSPDKAMEFARSRKLFEMAKSVIPGGVNSPVRAFSSVGGEPVFISRGEGSRMFDEDGNTYLDYVCSWGPLVFGHAHPRIVDAICRAAQSGTTFGAATAAEVSLAEMISRRHRSVEMVRLVSSGTEAVMSAVRLARGFTGRNKIVKFEGCYHGHSDSLLVQAGSGGHPGHPQQ